jgi:hypothetical protein
MIEIKSVRMRFPADADIIVGQARFTRTKKRGFSDTSAKSRKKWQSPALRSWAEELKTSESD